MTNTFSNWLSARDLRELSDAFDEYLEHCDKDVQSWSDADRRLQIKSILDQLITTDRLIGVTITRVFA